MKNSQILILFLLAGLLFWGHGFAQIKHRFLLVDEGGKKILHVDENDPGSFWQTSTGSNRDIQLIGNGMVLASKQSGGYLELDIATGTIEKDVSIDIGTTTTARRQSNGNTVLAGDNLDGESGITLVEVNTNGQVVRKASFSGLSTLRVMRQTAEGTFLVGTGSKIVEVNWEGDIVWEAALQISGGYGAYMGTRLQNGNTVVACGYDPSIHEYSAEKQLVRDIGGGDQPGADSINPNFYAGFQILRNGNIVVTNWQGHGGGHGDDGVQLLEYDTEGNLVWTWKDPEPSPRFSSLHHVLILDNLDTELMYDDVHGFMHPVFGCMDPTAPNYDSLAMAEDSTLCLTMGHGQYAPERTRDFNLRYLGGLVYVTFPVKGDYRVLAADIRGREYEMAPLKRIHGPAARTLAEEHGYSVKGLPSGVYLVRVVKTGKFVKAKLVVIP